MNRLALSAFFSVCLAACNASDLAEPSPSSDAIGGSGGATMPQGGGGGTLDSSSDTAGNPATGGTAGLGGADTDTATVGGGGGGIGGTGGAGGSAGAPQDPAPVEGPDAGVPDSGVGGSGMDDDVLQGDPVPEKPWLLLCPKANTQEQCCEMLCACLELNCSDSPGDAARIPECMSMCNDLTDFRARCQVYHCFESLNPNFTQDHESHCGHASGRVGGGSCTIIENQ